MLVSVVACSSAAPLAPADQASDLGAADAKASDLAQVSADSIDAGDDTWLDAVCACDAAVPPADASPSAPADATATADTGSIADAALPAADADAAGDAGPLPPPTYATGKFVDMWPQAGVKLPVIVADKSKMLEAWSSAGLLADLDKDGLLDYVVVDGDSHAFWGRALAPWKWYDAPLLTSKEPGLTSIAVTDEDSDGYPEILLGGGKIYYMVRTKSETYVDQGKDHGFELSVQAKAQHMAVGDLDSDGLLDVLVAEYSCTNTSHLRGWVNQGNHTYADETASLGIGHFSSFWFALPVDLDGDRQLDVLAGHEGCPPAKGNVRLQNQGLDASPRFKFADLPPVFVAPSPKGGTPMGAAVADMNGDGLLDIVASDVGLHDLYASGVTIEQAKKDPSLALKYDNGANHLLLRQANGSYKENGILSGLAWSASQTGQAMTGWSTGVFDFDGDGWLDVFVSNSENFSEMLLADEGGMRPVLFRNLDGTNYVEVSQQYGLPVMRSGRALAMADVDGDGDLDLFAGGQGDQPALYRNDLQTPNTWMQVQLRGHASNVWGIGAQVELVTDVRTLVAPVTGQGPTQTANLPTVHFGIPASWSVQKLVVHWPSGFDQVLVAPDTGKLLIVDEPPLVGLSARWINSGEQQAKVQVTAQAYSKSAKPQVGVATTIELAAGAKGSWAGPATCDPSGLCSRTWMPPKGGWGTDRVVVTLGGTPLSVRPAIRYDKLF
ncbi:MAG: CRTAC1 family protein [Deltaproteobacteria bacterium]|nr:CRTAC1 family protein [Deltaproteobacteria bacterium]